MAVSRPLNIHAKRFVPSVSRSRSQEYLPEWASLVVWLFAIFPVADVLTGLQYYGTGEDSVINPARIWKGGVILVALALVAAMPRTLLKQRFAFGLGLVVAVFAVANGLSYGGLGVNLGQAFQSQLFFSAVLALLIVVPPSKRQDVGHAYMWACWVCVAVSVIFCHYSGWGLANYGGLGSRGFFRSGNEASYLLVCSSCYVLFSRPRHISSFLVMALVSFWACWITATKSAVIGILLCSCWFLCIRFSGSKKTTLILATAVAALAIAHCEQLLTFSAKYSRQAERIERFLANSDVTTVVLSGRNTQADAAIEIIDRFGSREFLAGVGIHAFQSGIANAVCAESAQRAVEMDWLDLIGANGIVGFVWFYGILLSLFRRSLSAGGREATVASACTLFTILYATTAGHVAMSSSSLAMVGVLTSIAWGSGYSCRRPGEVRPEKVKGVQSMMPLAKLSSKRLILQRMAIARLQRKEGPCGYF